MVSDFSEYRRKGLRADTATQSKLAHASVNFLQVAAEDWVGAEGVPVFVCMRA